MGCSGNCSSCSGCARELVLTEAEVAFLEELAQIPFLPVARHMGEDKPAFPERDTPEMTLLLQCLEKKGLVSMDYDRPLKGFDTTAYASWPVKGSIALTARGQSVLELLELQGIREE